MSYVNTGIKRAKTLTIDKQVSGFSMSGYPKIYDITAAFTGGGSSYGVLNNQEFQELTESDYLERLADFKIYVQTAEGIASVDDITEAAAEAYVTDTTTCPIGT